MKFPRSKYSANSHTITELINTKLTSKIISQELMAMKLIQLHGLGFSKNDVNTNSTLLGQLHVNPNRYLS